MPYSGKFCGYSKGVVVVVVVGIVVVVVVVEYSGFYA